MKLEIREVKRCRNGAFGNYLLRGRDKALITVSLKKNKLLAEYGATVLHELLHWWTTIMRKKGFRITNVNEHKFIYGAENIIIAELKRITKGV